MTFGARTPWYFAVAVIALAASVWQIWPNVATGRSGRISQATEVVLTKSVQERGAPIQLGLLPSTAQVSVGVNHDWYVTVKTSDGAPLKECKIRFDGTMPEHGHGLPTAPRVAVAPVGDRFKVEGVRFSMPGYWRLRTIAECGESKQVSTFDIRI
jgi:hypothetical protein